MGHRTPPPAPTDDQHGDEIGSLSPDDETALDHAWATITDDDIARSIERMKTMPPVHLPSPPSDDR